jgi:DNA-binding Xre family transcriptional regulator
MTMHGRVNKSARLYGALVKQVSTTASERGISNPTLATESGIPEERLNLILEGQAQEVTLRELAGLSIALDVSLTALLGDS